MLCASGLGLQLNDKTILADIDLSVNPGDCLAIVGVNGSGKTSLLRCLLGWTPPTSGTVLLDDRPLQQWKPLDRASALAWLPQRPFLTEPLPVCEVVATARYRFSESPARQLAVAREMLEQLGIGGLADRSWSALSGGEAQRVALATLLAQEARVWLLDEPANHLDPAVQQHIYRFLIDQWGQGRTMVVVTHDLNLLLGATPPPARERMRVVGIAGGRIAFRSHLSDPGLPTAVSELYGLPIEIVEVLGRPHLIFGAPP